jgi:hypothetical protein
MPDYVSPILQSLARGTEVLQRLRSEAIRQKEVEFQQQQVMRGNTLQDRMLANQDIGQRQQLEATARPVAEGVTADKSRLVTYRNADGTNSNYELMTPEEIANRQLERLRATKGVESTAALDRMRQEAGINLETDIKKAQTLAPLEIQKAGAVAGAQTSAKALAEEEARNRNATITLKPEIADYLGLDPKVAYTRDEANKYILDYSKGKRDREHDAAQAEREMRRIMQQQQFQAGENAKGRAATITAAGIRANNQADSRAFDQEDKLRKEFVNQKPVKVFQETKRFADIARQAVQLSASGNANAGDQMLVNAMNKLIDPSSVVREGEYARTAQGQSIMGRIQGTVDKWMKGGGGLTQPERQQLLDAVLTMERSARQQYQPFEEGMRKVAGAYKLSPERIMLDPSLPSQGGGAPASALPAVSSQQQYDALPKGAKYMWNGQEMVKQ